MLSIVIPVFNEAEVLPQTLARLRRALGELVWEAIFVNDGSSDGTVELLQWEALSDNRIKVISLSRNFGHQAAVTAGLDFAEGEAVVVMDADLQDPPELLPQMLTLYQQGYDVVSPQRVSRQGETWFKKKTADVFYRVMARMTHSQLTRDVGDFRLFSRRAVLAIRSLREHHRFMRGLVAWLGLREAILPFERQPRAAGTTKYPLLNMLRFAWTAVASFSAFPLRVSVAAGTVLSAAGFAYLGWVISLALRGSPLVHGWASVVALQCIFSGMILLALGAVGDYVARSYEEAKGRPLYVIADLVNTAHTEIPRAIVLPPARHSHVPASPVAKTTAGSEWCASDRLTNSTEESPSAATHLAFYK